MEIWGHIESVLLLGVSDMFGLLFLPNWLDDYEVVRVGTLHHVLPLLLLTLLKLHYLTHMCLVALLLV